MHKRIISLAIFYLISTFLCLSILFRFPYQVSEEELTDLYIKLSKIEREESNSTVEYWSFLEDLLYQLTVEKDKKTYTNSYLRKFWKSYQNDELDSLLNEVSQIRGMTSESDKSFLSDNLYSPIGDKRVLYVSNRFGYETIEKFNEGIDEP